MAAKSWKEWEKPLIELEEGIAQLKVLVEREPDAAKRDEIASKIAEYEQRIEHYIDVKYSRLDPWEKVLVARSDRRPYTLDYVNAVFTDFVELEGDRRFGTDHAIVGGPAFLDGEPCMIVGQQKGRNIQERQYRNFAMAKPEGYRKAMRLMDMANRFNIPIVTFVDTPAADPGVESESRGIAESIAASMECMFGLEVPIVTVVIGEGGSGGAMAIGIGNSVLMLEHSVYSVIPPEGCAAILWRMPEKGPEAAAALRLTAQSALEMGFIDEVVAEPRGGAHRDPAEAATAVKAAVKAHLERLRGLGRTELRESRYDKFRHLGTFEET